MSQDPAVWSLSTPKTAAYAGTTPALPRIKENMIMIITDVIAELHAWITSGRSAHEVINTFIDQAQIEEQQQILDELGDVDLSEPRPDLTQGWSRVRGQLAYNALYTAIVTHTPGHRPLWLDADDVGLTPGLRT